jgi:threonine aldolase
MLVSGLTLMKINFASDNYSPAHPQVLEFLSRYNQGPEAAYGADSVTELASAKIKEHFGSSAHPFFVWNGTAANVLSLSAAVRPYESILCTDFAHIAVDECGAPEKMLGSKLIPTPSQNGKIDLGKLDAYFGRVGDQHSSQPKVISISQSTEYGTLYSLAEIKAITEFARKRNLYVHMDGARLSNAAVGLGLSFREFTGDAGIDFLSFGGTKNGLMGAECVVFLRPDLAENFAFIRKQGLQLSSKMRYLSAQFLAYFENDLWKKNATQANLMATRLGVGLRKLGGEIRITQPVQANGVFATFPAAMTQKLQERFHFYVWNAGTAEVRLMCSFNTTEGEIDQFLEAASSWR